LGTYQIHLGTAALVLIGTTTQLAAQESVMFDALTKGALACAEAVQNKDFAQFPITQRGWQPYSETESGDKLATSYSNVNNNVIITVINQPPQCSASWFISSSSRTDVLFQTANRALMRSLGTFFPNGFKAKKLKTVNSETKRAFVIGNAIGIIELEPFGKLSTLEFKAIHQANLTKLLPAPVAGPTEKPKDH
jgi:hypothetical protein